MILTYWGQYIHPFLNGLGITIEVTFFGLLVAIAAGAVLAALRSSRRWYLRLPARAYIDAFRSIPVLVLLWIAYYGLGQVGVRLPGVVAGVVALGAFYASLFAEVFRGGFSGVDRGQHEAADALGMGRWLRLWKVILPQAFVAILLPSTNLLSDLIKDTSLVITIGVADLMAHSYQASSDTFAPMDMFVLAGLMYFALYLLISQALGRWERNVQRRRG